MLLPKTWSAAIAAVSSSALLTLRTLDYTINVHSCKLSVQCNYGKCNPVHVISYVKPNLILPIHNTGDVGSYRSIELSLCPHKKLLRSTYYSHTLAHRCHPDSRVPYHKPKTRECIDHFSSNETVLAHTFSARGLRFRIVDYGRCANCVRNIIIYIKRNRGYGDCDYLHTITGIVAVGGVVVVVVTAATKGRIV